MRVLFLAMAVAISVSACSSKKDSETEKKPGDDMREAKTTEVEPMLRAIFSGARTYYLEEQGSVGTIEVLPHQFPNDSVGPTPPLGTCCQQQDGRCIPNAAQWNQQTWQTLQFSIPSPHYFSYEYRVDDPETGFEVYAYADLDCDGEYSTYYLSGTVENRRVTRAAEITSENPLE